MYIRMSMRKLIWVISNIENILILSQLERSCMCMTCVHVLKIINMPRYLML